jgi:hypothetical protein
MYAAFPILIPVTDMRVFNVLVNLNMFEHRAIGIRGPAVRVRADIASWTWCGVFNGARGIPAGIEFVATFLDAFLCADRCGRFVGRGTKGNRLSGASDWNWLASRTASERGEWKRRCRGRRRGTLTYFGDFYNIYRLSVNSLSGVRCVRARRNETSKSRSHRKECRNAHCR